MLITCAVFRAFGTVALAEVVGWTREPRAFSADAAVAAAEQVWRGGRHAYTRAYCRPRFNSEKRLEARPRPPTDAVRKGEVVASIPKDLVWRAPAPADLPPEGRAWQTQLATQLLLAAAAGEEAWAPWLDSLPTDFDGFAYLDCEDVDKWVRETAQRWGLPADRLAETLGERRGAYARRAAWFFSEEGPAALCGASPQSFRLAYCRVLSRAVTVDGKGCIGLVPFYDFLNHGRLGSEANVELLTYGQAVRRAGDASGAEGSFLDLDDMLLVATADIETGAELLTGYADAGADEDGYRVKLLLQYGICLPPA